MVETVRSHPSAGQLRGGGEAHRVRLRSETSTGEGGRGVATHPAYGACVRARTWAWARARACVCSVLQADVSRASIITSSQCVHKD